MARRRPAAVRLGIPALIVAILAVIALWRVPPARDQEREIAIAGTTGASLEDVRVREVTSGRTFWIGSEDMPTFVVLDPDVKRFGITEVKPGMRVSLTGLVRPAPEPAKAMQQWTISAAAASALQELGTYLHATEIHTVTN
jgi:hypothetical protein